MSYQPYYNSRPGWGTTQFQFGAPPAPSYQPQASWSGYDYYRAHAQSSASPDPSLYQHAWGRVRDQNRDFSGAGGLGVGMNEAKIWHHRAYGGLVDMQTLAPTHIGHAAAYEAFRTWVHNSSIYQPLSGDMDRQREALVGLSIAEASRLMAFTGRSNDRYGKVEASDSAAATASILYYWSLDREERLGMEYERGRQDDAYDDPYAYDTNVMAGRRGRGRSRSRPPGYGGSSGMPVPGDGGSWSGGQYPAQGVGYGGTGSSYGGGGSSYGGGGSAYGGGGSAYGGSPHVSSYMPSSGGYGDPVIPMGGLGGRARSRHSSISYPVGGGVPFSAGSGVGYGSDHYGSAGYPGDLAGYSSPVAYGQSASGAGYATSFGGGYGTPLYPQQQQQPITVVVPSGRSHHHRRSSSKHGKSKRHRSHSRHRS